MIPRGLLRPPAPFCVNVELTSLCNQKCVMCPLTAGNTLSSRDRGPMTPATWARVLPALRLIGQAQWIGYGETLLHPRALDYMAEADGQGVWSSLSTNGTTLSEEKCAALGRLRHLVHVGVSIDSLDPVVYRGIRKTPLAPVLAGLERLVRHVDRRRITVGSVMMRDNVEHLDGLPELVARLGLGKYQINVLHENKGRHVGGALGPEAADAVARVRAACEANGVAFVVDVPARLAANTGDEADFRADYTDLPSGAATRRCLLPWEFPFIDKDGRVFLCSNATGREDEVMGSLHEHGFMDIWHNARFQQVRRSFLEARTLPASCQTCTIQALGPHPLSEYRAEILSGPVALGGEPEQAVTVRVRNTGVRSWRVGEISVATARPRDRTSGLRTGHWPSVNRAARNAEPVAPGEQAVFRLVLAPPEAESAPETFQLVIDGRHWIAGSEFSVGRARTGPVLRRLARLLGA